VMTIFRLMVHPFAVIADSSEERIRTSERCLEC
jgi:hypothetical protein